MPIKKTFTDANTPFSASNSTAAQLAAIDKALQVSESRYRRLFETAQDGILLLHATTAQIEDVNPFLIDLLGFSHAEFLGKKLWEIGAFKDTALNMDAFAELQTRGFIRYDDLPLITKDGRSISVEFVSSLYDCEGVKVIQCSIRDNTKRNLAEIALRATTRSLLILSESNQALLSAKTEMVLLTEYCRIAVDTGGYRMAWVALAGNEQEKQVQTIAHFGHDEGYLDFANITWADVERGNGPIGRALRLGAVQVCEDIATDPAMAPWREEALRRGYRSSIALPVRFPDGMVACLTLYGAKPDAWSTPERKLLQEIAADLGFGVVTLRAAMDRIRAQEALQANLEKTIQVIAATLEERDPYTAGHQRRVANICSHIASELGLTEERTHGLHLAATIHDLGKISIPAEILAKPRRLTEMEFGLIKEHPNTGYNIIKDVDFPWPIATIIRQHHERIDGSGYPLGLTGKDILLESKILGVADVVEAMASHRPYRAGLGIDAALNEIATQRGKAFDPDVVDACLRLFRDHGFEIED